ncbi:hypothetical protein ABZ565_02170 [Streptomyces sp. NPDC016469]|uniref:hypothetical protein n=1 Tax=Streptomyces sp. NPDC016469 TaxID=3157191 RepID=UPI0033FABAFB
MPGEVELTTAPVRPGSSGAAWYSSWKPVQAGDLALEHHVVDTIGRLGVGVPPADFCTCTLVRFHTVQPRMSRLMPDLKGETRFQAGVQAASRGWLKL